MSNEFKQLAVLKAGAKGRGIAQIAAQTGVLILLFDTQPQALDRGGASQARWAQAWCK
jgi:3-hydroxybutyryl-CoA dehydrogenase